MSVFSFLSRILKPHVSTSMRVDGCLSHKLMICNGMISQSSKGVFALLPPFVRSLNKLEKLIDSKMVALRAQKLILPTLGERSLWEKSGRWNSSDGYLFVLQDRTEKGYCLQPTHEEEVTSFVASLQLSQKDLPVLLYQVTTKFRDELRPRFGLMRTREFLMKDLYSFDEDITSAEETYHLVMDAYASLFDELGLPYLKAKADAGHIGGQVSHEFHVPLSVGEDYLCVCDKCGTLANIELQGSHSADQCTCSNCSGSVRIIKGIEIGHCFLLGDRYSKCFNATYNSSSGHKLLQMGCYGIGVTRLLGVAMEHYTSAAFPQLSSEEISEIRLPKSIAPYSGAVVLQKGSAKDALSSEDMNYLMDVLGDHGKGSLFTGQSAGDILIDDRKDLTLGRKIVDLKNLGIPWILVAKSRANMDDGHELIDVYSNRSHQVNLHHARTAFYDPTNFDASSLPLWPFDKNQKIRQTCN